MRAPDYLAVAEPLMCVTAQCEWPMQRNPSPSIAGQQDFSDCQQPVKKRESQPGILDQGRMRYDSDPDWFLFFLFLSGIDLRLICHSRLNAVPASGYEMNVHRYLH